MFLLILYDRVHFVLLKAEAGVQNPLSLVVRRGRTGAGPVLLDVYGCHATPRWPS